MYVKSMTCTWPQHHKAKWNLSRWSSLTGKPFRTGSVTVDHCPEFHARHSWPVAQGHVTHVRVKSYTGPSLRDHVSHYFVEYEVRFAVPAEQCLTGTTLVIDREPPLCEGITRTRTTDSEALANTWGERHRFNPAVGVLHDPNGPGVKIVGEPVTLVYPWREII